MSARRSDHQNPCHHRCFAYRADWGTEHAEAVDAEIAATLRRREGAMEPGEVAGYVRSDRVPSRPRQRPASPSAGHDDRGVWVDTGREHGMAALGASMSAENARIAFESVKVLAACACRMTRVVWRPGEVMRCSPCSPASSSPASAAWPTARCHSRRPVPAAGAGTDRPSRRL